MMMRRIKRIECRPSMTRGVLLAGAAALLSLAVGSGAAIAKDIKIG